MRKNDNNNNTLFMVQYILIVPFKTESSHVDPRDSNKLYKSNVLIDSWMRDPRYKHEYFDSHKVTKLNNDWRRRT